MKDVVKRDELVLHLCGASLLVSLPIIFSPWYCPKASSEYPVLKHLCSLGFPGGPVVKNVPCNARDMGSIPGQGRSLML